MAGKIKSRTVASLERIAEIFEASRAGVPVLLSVSEVAQITGLSISNLNFFRLSGQGPAYLKVGRLVKYRLESVMQWLDGTQAVNSKSAIPISPNIENEAHQ